jgi:hypothetical protein
LPGCAGAWKIHGSHERAAGGSGGREKAVGSATSIRNYARNYADATKRLTGSTERLSEIGEVAVHRVTDDRIDDWLRFFDHDAFAGNPDWASCYCLEPLHGSGSKREEVALAFLQTTDRARAQG